MLISASLSPPPERDCRPPFVAIATIRAPRYPRYPLVKEKSKRYWRYLQKTQIFLTSVDVNSKLCKNKKQNTHRYYFTPQINIIAQLFQLSFLLWFETEVSISWDLFRSGASFLLTHHRPCCALPQLSQAPHLTSSLKSQGPLGDLVGPWGTPLETWRPPRCSPWWMASTSSVSLPPKVSIISEWLVRTRGCSDLSSVVRNWRRRPFSIVFETLCCAAISFDGDDRPNILRLFLVYVADCD